MAGGKARFVTSAPRVGDLPDHQLPEVAFCGRSNVGKSTLIGAVLGQPKMVRTSRTPGRTRLLNLFIVDEKLALVDLPGYGYAKLPKSERRKLDQMVQGYLGDRQGLAGVVQVIDARRDPVSEYDRFVAGWVLEQSRPLLLALTKSDQVAKNRRVGRARVIERQLAVPEGAAVICSGKGGFGIKELRKRLWELAAR